MVAHKRPTHTGYKRLDLTQHEDREEVADAFGQVAAWRAALTAYKAREDRETNPQRKRKLRLMIYNAEVQLRCIEEGDK